jgi:uncharacterized membrane protein YbhN (UPF0104 family)
MASPPPPAKNSANGAEDPWKSARELGKYTATIAIMVAAIYLIAVNLADVEWKDFRDGLDKISWLRIAGAMGLVVLNYLVLTGYDLIAVRYLKKQLPLRKVMIGAVAGYALSNVLGWIFGGTAVRYRMYTSWGFSFKDVVAFISILSLTFWLGMFLLAGITFAMLPANLPNEIKVNEHIYSLKRFNDVGAPIWGWIFLTVVALYLVASAFWRKPIHWGKDEYRLPPIGLSIQQLIVSACDFALACATLHLLLPPELHLDFGKVLVAFLAGMIITVTFHIPGGIGVLDATILAILGLAKDGNAANEPDFGNPKVLVLAGLLVFRVIYHLLPAIVGAGLFIWNEVEVRSAAANQDKLSQPAAETD